MEVGLDALFQPADRGFEPLFTDRRRGRPAQGDAVEPSGESLTWNPHLRLLPGLACLEAPNWTAVQHHIDSASAVVCALHARQPRSDGDLHVPAVAGQQEGGLGPRGAEGRAAGEVDVAEDVRVKALQGLGQMARGGGEVVTFVGQSAGGVEEAGDVVRFRMAGFGERFPGSFQYVGIKAFPAQAVLEQETVGRGVVAALGGGEHRRAGAARISARSRKAVAMPGEAASACRHQWARSGALGVRATRRWAEWSAAPSLAVASASGGTAGKDVWVRRKRQVEASCPMARRTRSATAAMAICMPSEVRWQ